MKTLLTLLIAALALPALAQTKPTTTTAPAGAAARPGPDASGLDVAIKSAKVDYIGLRKPLPGGNFEDLVSGQKLLIITLTITNKGTKEITYKSFNGTPEGKDDRASLTASDKKFLPLANFGELEPADSIKQATLKPGESVTDVVAFMPPQGDLKPQTLFLPAKNHNDPGLWKLPVTLDPAP